MNELNDLILEQARLLPIVKNAYENYVSRPTEVTVGGIEARIIQLDKNWAKYKANYTRIQSFKTEQNSNHEYFTNAKFSIETMEDNYFDSYGKFLERKNIIHRESNTARGPEDPRVITITGNNDRRLPPLPIPKFSGDFKEWISFRNLFYDLVTSSNRTDAEKFSYLKDALSDEPLFLIKNLTVTEGQFEAQIWKTLTDFYDNNKNIIYSHVNSIFALKKMQTESSLQLKKMLNTIS